MNWRSKPKGSAGLTLIEIAIVLVILGLLLGLGAGLIGMLTKRAKIVESRETVDATVEAVKGYTIMNGRLPNYSNFTTIVRSLYDAWQKPIFYIYDGNASNTSICDLTKTAITVRFCFNTDCSSYNEIQNVAFIVLSGGPNYNIQTTIAGSQEVSSNRTIRVYQQGVDNVDNHSEDFNRPEPFDDIVKYVTIYELLSLLKCPSTPPPSNCTHGTSPIQLLTQDRIYYCYYDSSPTECDNQAGACSELKKNELLSLEPNDKVRIYKNKRGNQCKTKDALTVNSAPCLEYGVGGCFDIQTADGNQNCQVQGYISGNNYVIQDR